ncbi:MAG: hypothetical protein OEY56_09275 [Cyclobacteriaceae bacterium]|nr:hypothetical protein [Cyclobacteriaceae bacterium]
MEDIQKMEEDEGFKTQALCYSRFLRKASEYTVEFQDVDMTNSILLENGISYAELRKKSKSEIASLLGVDAIISGRISRDKPMSEAAALITGLLIGYYGSTNKVYVSLSIHDGADASLLWNFDHTLSGSLGSNPESLTKALFNQVSRKFPYLRY